MCNECLNTIEDEVDVTDGYSGEEDDTLWDERDE